MSALNHAQIASLIAAVGDKQTILVEGELGTGKSSILNNMRAMPHLSHYHFAEIDCAVLDVGDHMIPVPDLERGVTRNLPNERYGVHMLNQYGINGSQPVCIMLDEMAKAPRHIQASLAPLFYDRRLGNYRLPEGSIVFGTTNLGGEGLGDIMQAHTRNRISVVQMSKPTVEEWTAWAANNNIAPELVAFVHQNPRTMDSFINYKGSDLAKENPYIFNPKVVQGAFVSPRSLAMASPTVIAASKGLIDDSVMTANLIGTIGESAARDMAAYITYGRALPTFEEVVMAPKATPLPENVAAQIIQAFQFISRTEDRIQADSVCTYVERMQAEIQALFVTTCSKAGAAKLKNFAMCAVFNRLLKDNLDLFGNN